MCEENLDDIDTVCHQCSLSLQKVIKKFLRVMSNVLMNNYSKNLNESNDAHQLAVKLTKIEEKKKQEEEKIAEGKKKEEKNAAKRKIVENGKEKDCSSRKIKKLNS